MEDRRTRLWRQSEHELVGESGFLDLVLNLTREGIAVLDLRGAISVYNRRMHEITGYQREEVHGPQFPGMLFEPGAERQRGAVRFEQALHGHDIREEEWQICRKNGERRAVVVSTGTFSFHTRRLMIVTLLDVTDANQQQQRLVEYQDQLRALSSELLVAEERERRRVARGIHDGIGDNLALAKIKLGQLLQRSTSDRDELATVRELLEESIVQARELTFELSPPVLYEIGLDAALEWLTERTAEHTHLTVHCDSDGRRKPLDAATRALLYSSVRELLHNVIKHSGASTAWVESRRVGDRVELEVRDNGVGFAARASAGPGLDDAPVGGAAVAAQAAASDGAGFGLFSIRERLSRIGGALEVRSEPNLGAQAAISAPLVFEQGDAG